MNILDVWNNAGIWKFAVTITPLAWILSYLAGDDIDGYAEQFGSLVQTMIDLIYTLYTFVSYSVGFILWVVRFAFADFFLFLMLAEFFILVVAAMYKSDENVIINFVRLQTGLIMWLIHFLYFTMERMIDVLRLLKPAG